ncbi:MAG: NADH-quinone oxidoreductase subunit NuoH [Chloroflexota bacterium]|nr:NADH-quinone oxidoreductase subunit NuoH [Chloroflexota bacterium]
MAGTIATPPRRRIPAWLIIGALVAVVLFVVVPVVFIATNANAVGNFVFDAGTRVNPNDVVICYGADGRGCPIIHSVIYSLIFFFVVLTGFAYTTLLERKFISYFQQRIGPNRVGPFGLLQPLADGVKLIFKEDIIPSGADRPVYLLAPILKTVPAIIILAVVPLGPDLLIPWFDGMWYRVPLGLTDPNVGVLWLMAITSIGTYGVVLAGWSSNNKYAMIGGLRASAQMLSYELSLGLTMAVPILIVGSMSVGDIIRSQTMFYEWFIFQNPLAAGILAIALLAEISRAPFDLPEAEQELTQGFMTEYSGMKFAMFMMSEYLGMIAISVIVSALYLGGYNDGFGLVDTLPFLGPVVLIGKVILLMIGMVWVRATLPRIRYDRLMQFGWKILLPLALVAVFWSAIAVMIGDAFGNPVVYGVIAGAVFMVVLALGFAVLRRSGDLADKEPALADDPMITGDRQGPAWVGLQVLGALIAIPFALWTFTLKALDSLASLAPDDKKQDDANSEGNAS